VIEGLEGDSESERVNKLLFWVGKRRDEGGEDKVKGRVRCLEKADAVEETLGERR